MLNIDDTALKVLLSGLPPHAVAAAVAGLLNEIACRVAALETAALAGDFADCQVAASSLYGPASALGARQLTWLLSMTIQESHPPLAEMSRLIRQEAGEVEQAILRCAKTPAAAVAERDAG